MRYNYQARTEKGEMRTGVVEASSKEAALVLLQKYKLYVTYLEEVKPPLYAREIKFLQKVSLKDVVLFSRQLAIMFSSKVPLSESLTTLANQIQNPVFKEKIFDLVKAIEGGSSFSEALSRHPDVFSPFFVAMVKAGEQVGKLSESLNYLANHLEREYNLKAKIKGAMYYPAFVLVLFFIIGSFMAFSVLPGLEEILLTAGAKTPGPTKIVLSTFGFLRENWLPCLLLPLAVIFVIFYYYRTEKGKKFFDALFLQAPIISPLLKQLSLYQIAINLSTLISGGLLITGAFDLVGQIVGNTLYKEAVLKIKEEIKKGTSISTACSYFPEIFTPLFIQMVAVGEKTGTLDTALMNVANFYQAETERTIENLLKLLEPIIIVLLAVVVGGLVASIFMPLYTLVETF